MEDRYIFWLDDPTILYKNGNYIYFIPTPKMSRIEQLNAVTRFSIYYIIIMLLFQKSSKWFYIPIIAIILTIILYNIYKFDPLGKNKELHKEKFNSIGNFSYINDKPVVLETGFYDSDGKLTFDSKKQPDIKYSVDDMDKYNKASCCKPTFDNPFMNPLVSDFNTETNNDVKACNVDDEEIQNKMTSNFNIDLFRDIEDLFDVKNSQRQFLTVPTPGVPSDQQSFANWLYKSPGTCKEDQENCLRYEDIRFKR